jgi:septal ring factor EnvC (AmiA/AmiB activator)
MRTTAALLVSLLLAPIAFAEELSPGGSLPPSLRGQIAVSKAMSPAQKVAALEDLVNEETDRRVDLDTKIAVLTQENDKLTSSQAALLRNKASADNDLARTRDVLSRVQRDFESLRGEYTRITKIVGLSLAFIAPLTLLIFALLGWLLAITRKLAIRVHDVPTMAKLQEHEAHVAHLQDQLNAEKSHSEVLRERLANLGIVD